MISYSGLVMVVMMVLYFANSLIWYFAHLIPMVLMLRSGFIMVMILFSFSMVCIRVVQKVIY